MTGYIRIQTGKHSNTHVVQSNHLLMHFIESGFDIINPVQINASGMDPWKLKKEIW